MAPWRGCLRAATPRWWTGCVHTAPHVCPPSLWLAVRQVPLRVWLQLVVLNIPHPVAMRRAAGFAQLLRSWYMFFFQLPLLPELYGTMCDYVMLGYAYTVLPWGYRKAVPSLDDINAYKWALSQPGAPTCTVNYYRAAFVSTLRLGVIACPTLMVWGDKDAFLGSELLQGSTSPKLVSDVSVRIISGASHWVQCDAPAEVNVAIDTFLKEKGV